MKIRWKQIMTGAVVIMLLPAGSVLSAAEPARPEWQLSGSVGVGTLSYEEDFSRWAIDSEWEGNGLALDGKLRLPVSGGWILGGVGRFMASSEEEEKWIQDGALAQRNQMNVMGLNLMMEGGYQLVRQPGFTLDALLGAGMRRQRFERDEMVLADATYGAWDQSEEDVSLSLLNAAAEWTARLTDKLSLKGRLEAGYILAAEAENNLLDDETIEGEGGLVYGAEIRIGWKTTLRSELSCGLVWDYQEIHGDSQSYYGLQEGYVYQMDVEWPDNTLESLWAQLCWSYSF